MKLKVSIQCVAAFLFDFPDIFFWHVRCFQYTGLSVPTVQVGQVPSGPQKSQLQALPNQANQALQ